MICAVVHMYTPNPVIYTCMPRPPSVEPLGLTTPQILNPAQDLRVSKQIDAAAC